MGAKARSYILLLLIASVIWKFPTNLYGQVHHHCPVYSDRDYENPLFENWLSAYDVRFYHINLEVDNRSTEISGHVTMLAKALRDLDTLVLELQDGLDVTDVQVDSLYHPVIRHQAGAIYIPINGGKKKGEMVTVIVSYQGDAGKSQGFFTGISNGRDAKYNADVTYTLSEPHNASDWFPVKQVLEDKIDSAWVYVTCDKSLMAASNGLLREVVDVSPGKQQFRWKTHYPIAYYLLSIAVADYMEYSFKAALSMDGDSVLVQNFIYDNDEVLKDWEDEILMTGDMITLFSELIGDYPFAFEKYGHAHAPMGGGMEHQTMTTISNFGFTLVAHELAHQWFGDYVTCGNWQDIWINEGFASYMEYITLEYLMGREYAFDWMEQAMSIALSENEGSVYVPSEDVEDPYRLFSFPLSYKKGAILLHMIRYELNNDDLFFEVLRTYIERYANSLATSEDFRNVLEERSGIDFSCFFEQWYYGKGYPNFSITWYQKGDTLFVSSSQTTTSTETPFFKTHFDLLLEGEEGVKKIRLLQSEAKETYAVPVDFRIMELTFDPENYILKSSSVEPQFPGNALYAFGPNPVIDELFIRFRYFTESRNVVIASLDGKEIKRFKIHENPVFLDISELSDGPYMLVINDGNSRISEKILKLSD